MAKISVITPAYNAEKYISQTIESVIGQTFTDWEMIIVDDASKDNTYNIACEFAELDKRIRVIKQPINLGVAAARNIALDIATGEYIAFLDSDDLWMPDKLKKQYNFMENNKLALTYTMYQKFSDSDKQGGKVIKVPKEMTYKKIFGNTSIACLTVMVNRKMVGKFHMPPLIHTEDQCTWQEILSRGYKAYALNENLALYRESVGSLTNNKKSAALKQWNTYRKYHRFSVFKSFYYFCCYAINAIIKNF